MTILLHTFIAITGGFCVPGECRCVDGYSGDNCDIRGELHEEQVSDSIYT